MKKYFYSFLLFSFCIALPVALAGFGQVWAKKLPLSELERIVLFNQLFPLYVGVIIFTATRIYFSPKYWKYLLMVPLFGGIGAVLILPLFVGVMFGIGEGNAPEIIKNFFFYLGLVIVFLPLTITEFAVSVQTDRPRVYSLVHIVSLLITILSVKYIGNWGVRNQIEYAFSPVLYGLLILPYGAYITRYYLPKIRDCLFIMVFSISILWSFFVGIGLSKNYSLSNSINWTNDYFLRFIPASRQQKHKYFSTLIPKNNEVIILGDKYFRFPFDTIKFHMRIFKKHYSSKVQSINFYIEPRDYEVFFNVDLSNKLKNLANNSIRVFLNETNKNKIRNNANTCNGFFFLKRATKCNIYSVSEGLVINLEYPAPLYPYRLDIVEGVKEKLNTWQVKE